MGYCEICKVQINDKYKYCVACNQKNTSSNSLQNIEMHLKHINWNLGLIANHLTGNKDVVKQIKKDMRDEKKGEIQ